MFTVLSDSNSKRRIAAAFNKAVNAYDQGSSLQFSIAETLIENLKQYVSHSECLLDVGCGTGTVIQQLLKKIPTVNSTAIDIAYAMAKQSSTYLNAVQADMEHLPFVKHSFDVIFASMSLQWSFNLGTTISELARTIKHQGYLAFALPIEGTLTEITQAKQAIAASNHFEFTAENTIKKLLENNKFSILENHIKKYDLYFDDLTSVMQHLKNNGTYPYKNIVTKHLLGKNYLINLQTQYAKMFAINNKLPVTYRIAFFIASKHGD